MVCEGRVMGEINIMYELRELSEDASKYMNYGEHNYKELCKTKIFKKAKALLLEHWRREVAEWACDSESIILNNKDKYWCEECNQIQSLKFITIHHINYDWNYIFDPDDIIPICISCHIKHHNGGHL